MVLTKQIAEFLTVHYLTNKSTNKLKIIVKKYTYIKQYKYSPINKVGDFLFILTSDLCSCLIGMCNLFGS